MFEAYMYLFAFFLAISLPPVLLLVLPVLFIQWYFKKGKKMILKVVTGVVTFFAVVAITFNIVFPTAFPYVDWWILGKTQDEISVVYCEEWSDWGRSFYQRAPHTYLGYYVIRCGENGQVYSVETADSEP